MSAVFDGSCHCGTIGFRVTLSEGLTSARRCDCSYCTMRGGVAVSAALDGMTFLRGEDALSLYQFNTGTARHYFCSRCGIYTHHQRRSNPQQLGISVACLKDVDLWDMSPIPVNDGRAHPSDGAPPRIAGVLRFERGGA